MTNNIIPGNFQPPIIGQPFKPETFMPIIMGTCQCEAKQAILLVAIQPVTCQKCHRTWIINKLEWVRETGQCNIEVAQVLGMPQTPPV